eukprot:TRINITY_DN8193_c0_g1_i1.p1 TRINITY_DN8193_c0_g1~~TRINITY_DN8193_c0_g1_i1.p1  ORF type:complete len:278 (-),score=100.65 TRINITY_DN8193_c0_g1_i1:65-898(-)
MNQTLKLEKLKYLNSNLKLYSQIKSKQSIFITNKFKDFKKKKSLKPPINIYGEDIVNRRKFNIDFESVEQSLKYLPSNLVPILKQHQVPFLPTHSIGFQERKDFEKYIRLRFAAVFSVPGVLRRYPHFDALTRFETYNQLVDTLIRFGSPKLQHLGHGWEVLPEQDNPAILDWHEIDEAFSIPIYSKPGEPIKFIKIFMRNLIAQLFSIDPRNTESESNQVRQIHIHPCLFLAMKVVKWPKQSLQLIDPLAKTEQKLTELLSLAPDGSNAHIHLVQY